LGLVRDMLYGFGVQEGTETDIVLSGSNLSEDLLHGLVPDFPLARTWRIADIPGIRPGSSTVECGPDYALAAGGVLGEMGISGKTVPRVTDRVPLGRAVARKLRENRRAIPSAVLGCFILCLGLHYGYTQFRIASYRTEIRKLEEQRKRLEGPLEEKKRLKTELAGIEEKRGFLQETLPSQNRRILALLTALSEMVPHDVVVNEIDQLDAGTFTLKGNAFRGKAITEFSDALSSIESCGGVFLVSVSRAGEALNPRRRILPYDFTIHVSFGEDHDS
jgi:Tfp pilus assembly protein PilN